MLQTQSLDEGSVTEVEEERDGLEVVEARRGLAYPQRQYIDLRFLLSSELGSFPSPIWMMESSNDSRGHAVFQTTFDRPKPDTVSPTLNNQRNSQRNCRRTVGLAQLALADERAARHADPERRRREDLLAFAKVGLFGRRLFFPAQAGNDSFSPSERERESSARDGVRERERESLASVAPRDSDRD